MGSGVRERRETGQARHISFEKGRETGEHTRARPVMGKVSVFNPLWALGARGRFRCKWDPDDTPPPTSRSRQAEKQAEHEGNMAWGTSTGW